jgi:head-tail adaptor
MRGELNDTLPGTAVIHSRTTTADGQGGYTQTFAASATVDARLSPEALRGGELAAGGRLAEVSPWILTVAAETSLDETMRVVYNSATYEVVEVLTRTPWELSRRVRLTEVD